MYSKQIGLMPKTNKIKRLLWLGQALGLIIVGLNAKGWPWPDLWCEISKIVFDLASNIQIHYFHIRILVIFQIWKTNSWCIKISKWTKHIIEKYLNLTFNLMKRTTKDWQQKPTHGGLVKDVSVKMKSY